MEEIPFHPQLFPLSLPLLHPSPGLIIHFTHSLHLQWWVEVVGGKVGWQHYISYHSIVTLHVRIIMMIG